MIIKFLISFISILSQLLFWAVFISVVLSWFSEKRSKLGMMLDQIVVPLLRPFSWARIGMFDFSPILLIILLAVIRNISVELLLKLM